MLAQTVESARGDDQGFLVSGPVNIAILPAHLSEEMGLMQTVPLTQSHRYNF